MELEERLRSDLKESLKAGSKSRVSTIRLVLSEIRNEQIEKGDELTAEELVGVLSREARKRREAIEEYGKAGRDDLVQKENEELEIIKDYMPRQMSEEEIRRVIEESIEQTGASTVGDLGKVMGRVMPQLKGKADGKVVNRMVREILEG